MKKLALALLLSSFTAFSLSSCFFFPDEEPLLDPPTVKQDDVTYVTYTAKRAAIVSRVVNTGYITSRTEAECYFTDYTGQLKAVYPRPGDFVEEGQLIAELDVGELEFDLETARLNMELARLNYAATGSADDSLAFELAENNYEQLKNRMDGSKIFAPMSGQVSFVENLFPGEEINPYRVLVRIIDPDDLRASAEANETTPFKVGDDVTVVVGDFEYSAVITLTPWEARAENLENSNVIWAEFTSDGPGFAEMGRLADIVLIRDKKDDAVVIPKNLVKTLGDQTYVQIFEDGEKRDVDVVTGISNATEIEIVSGLQEGQQVVVK